MFIKNYFDNTKIINKYVIDLFFKNYIEQNYKFVLKYYFKFLFLNNPESILNIDYANNLRKKLANHIKFLTNTWEFDIIIPLNELVFLTALNLGYFTNKPIVQIFTNKMFLENNKYTQNLLYMIKNKNILFISNNMTPNEELKNLINKLKKYSKKISYVSCSPFYLLKNDLLVKNRFNKYQNTCKVNNFDYIKIDYIADILKLN